MGGRDGDGEAGLAITTEPRENRQVVEKKSSELALCHPLMPKALTDRQPCRRTPVILHLD
jgi:hypothetical protein